MGEEYALDECVVEDGVVVETALSGKATELGKQNSAVKTESIMLTEEHHFLEEQELKLRRNTPFMAWAAIVAVTLNYIMVPAYLAYTGWALGIILLIWGWTHSLVTGLQLEKICTDYPNILSYPELGAFVGGKLFKGKATGQSIGFWTIWALQVIGNFLVSSASIALCAQFLQAIFPSPCYTWWIIISYGVAVVLSQIPTFKESHYINLGSIIANVIMFVLCIVNLAITGRLEEVSYEMGSIENVMNSVAGIAFVFAGHSIFPEVQREMKEPGKFRKTIWGMYLTIGSMMAIFGLLGYGFFGSEANINILQNFNWNGSVVAANVLNLLAFFGALVIGNVITMMSVQAVLKIPFTGWKKPISYGLPVGLTRFILRFAIVTLQLLLCLLVPFIADLTGLSGAIAFSVLTFGFPPLACLVIYWNVSSRWSKVADFLMIGLSIFVMIVGAYGSIVSMVESAGDFPAFHLPCDSTQL